jgi:hypothetical protein
MTGAERLDACRDAGALIRATASRDREGAAVVLDHSDNRAVLEVMATIVVAAVSGYGPGFIGDLCAELRYTDQEDTTP